MAPFAPDRDRAGESRTDGGYPATAGIMPTDVDHLRSFLDEHAAADAFQLEYTDEGKARTSVVADASIVERTVERPAAAVAIECVGLPPGTGEFRVRFDDVRFVHAVDPPDDLFAVDGDTPTDRANDLADLAAVAPDRVDLPVVVDLLGSSERAAREAAIDVAKKLAEARPADCLAVLPALRSRLTDDDHATAVLDCLASLAASEPSEIAPFVDEITPYLQADDDQRRHSAARVLSRVAGHDPADAVDAAPALSTLVADRGPGFEHAVYALNQIAADHPGEVRPATRDLGDALADSSLADAPRLNAAAALGKVASEYPDAAVDRTEAVAALLDADNQRLRANAAGVLSDVATAYATALEPYVDELAALLDAEDDYTLVNATAALARVAETDPDAVEPYTDQYITLLDHDHRLVRLNACWALGHLQATEAESRLGAVKTGDDDEAVRTRAAWALSEIETAH